MLFDVNTNDVKEQDLKQEEKEPETTQESESSFAPRVRSRLQMIRASSNQKTYRGMRYIEQDGRRLFNQNDLISQFLDWFKTNHWFSSLLIFLNCLCPFLWINKKNILCTNLIHLHLYSFIKSFYNCKYRSNESRRSQRAFSCEFEFDKFQSVYKWEPRKFDSQKEHLFLTCLIPSLPM